MASDTNETLQDFVLLDETELHLPDAGDVVVVGEGARDSFWQLSQTEAPLPPIDDLISDHSGDTATNVLSGFETGDQPGPAQPCLLAADADVPAAGTHSLVDIIVDDGATGPFVA